jgi:hypothetical protein
VHFGTSLSLLLLSLPPTSHVMDIPGDEIADAVLQEFERWPKKRKPLIRNDGTKEWVPLSGIVAQGWPPENTSKMTKLMMMILY